MKKTFLFPIILLALVTVSFVNPPDSLVGRWQKRSPKGVTLGAVFRADSSYDGFVNGKSFVSGKYYVRQDTFRLQDASCNARYYGTYKLTFVTSDSVRLMVIEDTCGGRRRGTDGLAMSRVKPTRP